MTALRVGAEPLLVRGLELPRPSLDEVRAAVGDALLWAIVPPAYTYVEVRAQEYFDAFVAGTEKRNIVDHYLEGERFEALFPVPELIGADDLLAGDPRTAHYRRCLVMTPAGAYTANHADGYGLAGWLYLVDGEKLWEFWGPGAHEALYDPVSNDYYDPEVRPPPPAAQERIDALPRMRLLQRPGDLVVIPGAAVHRVWTRGASRGWGGSFLPRAQLKQAIAFNRFELQHWPPGALDFQKFAADVQERAR